MAIHVLDEAKRCLNCKVPQCQKGCPIHTPIPQVIQLMLNGELDKAGWMLFENNPLTTVCSLVCNHENQCEGHCVLGKKGAPVHFSTIENYISSTYSSKMVKDVARTALRKGVRWLQCFSRTSTVAASQHEYNYALLEGVEFVYCKIPVEITDEGVIFADAEEKEDGSIEQIPGTEKLYPADSVIISISQGPRNQLVNTTKGLDANQRGLLVADEEGHTSRPEIFASGDVVNGARTVVEAVAHSKKVAEAMDKYMQGLTEE